MSYPKNPRIQVITCLSTGLVLSLGLFARASEETPEPPILTLGTAVAQPGETDVLVPVSVTVPEGNVQGWIAILAFDAKNINVASFESALPTAADWFRNQDWFAEPGRIAFGSWYTFPVQGPEASWLTNRDPRVVGHLRLCITPGAPAGNSPLTVLETTQLAKNGGTGTTVFKMPIGHVLGSLSDIDQTPVIDDGSIKIQGDPLVGSNCEAYVPPAAPEIGYSLHAPDSVAAGSRCSVDLRVSTNKQLSVVAAALSFEANALSCSKIVVAPELLPAGSLVLSSIDPKGQIGLVVIPDATQVTSQIPVGVSLLATLELDVRDSFSGATDLGFLDGDNRIVDPSDPESELVFSNVAGGGDVDGLLEPGLAAADIKVGSLIGLRLEVRALTRFVRGDSNSDQRVDLSDAVATLRYLFNGDAEPGCLDGADADDSGAISITDPILLLRLLFLGERSAAAASISECGDDSTHEDGLDCVSDTGC